MNCLICNNEVKSFESTHLTCNNCGVIYQKDRVPVVDYDENYIEQYNVYHTTRMMSLLRAGIVSSFCGEKSKILDVGCGNGDFLKVMKINGHECFGLDVDSRDLSCINLLNFDQVISQDWDVVTFFDSLEHFSDLDSIKKINTNFFILSVPCVPEDLDNIKQWKHWKPGEHFWHFSDKALKILFNNFDLISKNFAEDIIRGKINKHNNITTYVFKKK